MKLYAPAYYKDFSCIADRCRHSCCIGWEIDVDEDTCEFYQSLQGDYAEAIRQSIDATDTPHFTLAAHDRCPHLDAHGLCRIIKAYGHDALCEICREHPRIYHDTPHGKEVGLGLSCEEACRIVLGSDDFAQMIEIEQLDGESDSDAYDATLPRAEIYALLAGTSLSYSEKLRSICDAFAVSPACITDEEWHAMLDGLEYLDDAHRELFSRYSSACEATDESAPILTRALAYFIFRHCSDAEDADAFRASLGLSLFFTQLLCCMICAGTDPHDAARILSEELEYSEDNTDTIRSVFFEVLP